MIKLHQVYDIQAKITTREMIKKIYSDDGFKGFFRGFYFNTCVTSISQLIWFVIMDLAKHYSNNFNSNNYSIKKEALISFSSGFFVSMLTLPLWTLKTRISLTKMTSEKGINQKLRYSARLIYDSYKFEGFLHLYKGLISTFFIASYGMIQMTLYNSIKYQIERRKVEFNGYYPSIVGIFSRISASIILYPFNVVRTRQQQFDPSKAERLEKGIKENVYFSKNTYNYFGSSMRMIYLNEGILGFYKGIFILMVRQFPFSATFFYVFEKTKSNLTEALI